MPHSTTPPRKPPRFHRGYLLAAFVLVALIFVGSLIVFPEWTRTNGWVFVLLAVVIFGVVEFVANWRTAFEARRDEPPAATPSMTQIDRSGGTDIEAQEVTFGGDVVGRDKFQASGDIAMHDIIKMEAPAMGVVGLHQLPPPPRDFTGRKDELNELTTAIETGGVTISGVQGMGGVGKTALALKLAEQLAPRYPDAQFYLDLKGAHEQKPLTVAEALSHVVRAYHPTAKLPESEAELRGLYQSVLHGQRALLLMDNARDAAQVQPLVPPGSCVLIVTSRQHFHISGWFAKDLNALPPDDARTLLLKIAARIGEFADEIVQLCGYLPLALTLAGKALAERIDLSPADYGRRLANAKARLSLIDASLSLSYDLLSAEMRRLWCMLAVFPDSFDAAAAAAVWQLEPDPAQDTLSELVKYSLLEYTALPSPDDIRTVVRRGAGGEAGRYRLHDLARLFAGARLEGDERDIAQQHHAEHFKNVLSAADDLYLEGGDNVLRGMALFDLEWTNIQAGQAWAATHIEEDEVAAQLCNTYASSEVLTLRQHPHQQIRWLEAALAAARRLKNRSMEGVHLGNLGLAYANLGEPRRAIEFYEQVLVIARAAGYRRGEGVALSNLGLAYANLGEPRRAIEFYEQALVIDREIGDRRGEGVDLGNLGFVYTNLGEPRRTIEFNEQALAISREIGDRRGEGAALGNLGSSYVALGELRRAIEFCEQAFAIAREIGDRRGEGNSLGNLGNAYAALGETRRAIEFYEQQLPITREIGDRRGEGNALWNMSLALDKLGDRAQAIAHAEAALKIFEQIEDPNTARVRKRLAEWRGENSGSRE